ncbi:MAG: hypothetical protein J7L52_01710 [Thermotogae bacterium]|nr:hypothetical protein [Thermotogota bacterium]
MVEVIIPDAEKVIDRTYTGKDGSAVIRLPDEEEFVNIRVSKFGHALSEVENIFVEDIKNDTYTIQLRKAMLNPDPFTQHLPRVNVSFFDLLGNELDIRTTIIKSDFKVRICVESSNHVKAIYAGLGKIPGSEFISGERFSAFNATSTEFRIPIHGFNGTVDFHVVVYDHNDNRVDRIFYLNIQSPIRKSKMYVVKKTTDKKSLTALTRRRAIKFYGADYTPLEVKDKLPKVHAAPKGSNLWVDVTWKSYSEAIKEGSIDGDQVLEPDGYNIYRSFDGKVYEKIGFVSENWVVNKGASYRDGSPLLKPGKRVYYKVSTVYGAAESTPTYLGSVVPLESFEVILVTPEDGATGVSRTPTFVWGPTQALYSQEGEVEYYYVIWIYDMTLGGNQILPGEIDENGEVAITAIVANSPVFIKVSFSYFDWIIMNEQGAYVYPYERLEANKVYSWGMDLAMAVVEDEDSVAFSVAVDNGYGVDPFEGETDEFATFVTGEK